MNMVDWKTIDSAPEFGEEFMAWVMVDPDHEGFWAPRVFQDCNGCFQYFDYEARDHWVEQPHWKPTHWMPQPSTPHKIEGTSFCPICGWATPHKHNGEEITKWRNSQAGKR